MSGVERPAGVTALSLFFLAGALMAGTAAFSLAVPGSVLEPIWRLNPRGHAGLAGLQAWGVVLMVAASLACAAAGIGLWRVRPWGRRVAIGVLLVQLAGDVVNSVTGVEPRAIVGLPFVAGLLWYLARASVRGAFRPAGGEAGRWQPGPASGREESR
jgi:hypothetical protein